MIRTRERPEVAGRIGVELDDDLVARHAAREDARRNGQLIAAERPRETPADEAVCSVGADHERRAPRTGAGVEPHAAHFHGHVAHADALEDGARSHGCRKHRSVERRAACNDERTIAERHDGRFRRRGRVP